MESVLANKSGDKIGVSSAKMADLGEYLNISGVFNKLARFRSLITYFVTAEIQISHRKAAGKKETRAAHNAQCDLKPLSEDFTTGQKSACLIIIRCSCTLSY